MIKVVTTVHKSDLLASTVWRIHTCVVDFGEREGPLMFSSPTMYPSPEAAHAASRAQALDKIRTRGHTEPEDEIVWKLQVIP